MDALSMATSTRSRASDEDFLLAAPTRIPARVAAALATLLEAHDYALDLGSSLWEFAVELATLRELKLSNSDLRWLVAREIVEHGVEVTVGDKSERCFQHPDRLRLARKVCFVLTDAGVDLARDLVHPGRESETVEVPAASEPASLSIAAPPAPPSPTWDRDRHELRVGRKVVKQFKIPAPDQESILAVFEEASWAQRIDDPLDCDDSSRRFQLRKAIEALNCNQKQRLIEFVCDAAGGGVTWAYRQTASGRV